LRDIKWIKLATSAASVGGVSTVMQRQFRDDKIAIDDEMPRFRRASDPFIQTSGFYANRQQRLQHILLRSAKQRQNASF